MEMRRDGEEMTDLKKLEATVRSNLDDLGDQVNTLLYDRFGEEVGFTLVMFVGTKVICNSSVSIDEVIQAAKAIIETYDSKPKSIPSDYH